MNLSARRNTSFRQSETQAVLQAWEAGQSVSVVGIGSAGKSNFVQHLATQGTSANHLIPVVIDANLLGPLPERGAQAREPLAFWAGCELLLHRIFMTLYPFEGYSDDEKTTLYQAYEALQDGANPLYAMLALRYLELGLSVPLRRGERVVFLFDEFERFAATVPPVFFQSMRGLRDLSKRQLVFTTASRGLLPQVMADAGVSATAAEPFVELFADHVVYVGAYARADAEAMVTDLLVRRGAVLHAAAIGALLDCTGGHPGLLRAAINVVIDHPALGALPTAGLSPALLTAAAVTQECGAIWGSLTALEQAAIEARCRGQAGDTAAEAILQRKGLLDDSSALCPPLFAAYIADASAQ
jgi:hypothetical protein